jgi:hypothetical protein
LPEAAHHLAQHAAEEQQQDQFHRKDCRCMLRRGPAWRCW